LSPLIEEIEAEAKERGDLEALVINKRKDNEKVEP
jgi:hypothetical protein